MITPIETNSINGYGLEDPGFALLREVAQKYCPEELQAERLRVGEHSSGMRKAVLPDESLNLSGLEAGFMQLLAGGSGYGDLPYLGDTDAQTSSLPKDDGFGIGIPTTRRRTR